MLSNELLAGQHHPTLKLKIFTVHSCVFLLRLTTLLVCSSRFYGPILITFFTECLDIHARDFVVMALKVFRSTPITLSVWAVGIFWVYTGNARPT